MLGTIGQVVGIIGMVVCLVLAIGVVFGRGWAVGTVALLDRTGWPTRSNSGARDGPPAEPSRRGLDPVL